MTFIIIITLLCIFIPCYVYAGYPLILILLNKIIKKKQIQISEITPNTTLIVSCYNEANVIRKKIENCLALDYPKDKLQIIFVSDGSDDGTDEIIKEYAEDNIHLVRQEGRLGKTSGLNLATSQLRTEIIIFSDANALYQKDAIHKLVRNFNDPTVGYVVGAALYVDTDADSASSSEDSYWQYEIYIKKLESNLHSVVGGDGAIYAIRSHLYETLDAKDINDFVNPLQIIAKGYRGIFDQEAKCFEETAGSFYKEGRRKERIVNRSFRGLMKVKSVLNPFKTGLFSLEVISHKLLRWLIPFFIIGMTVGFLVLSYNDFLYFQIFLLLEITFFWLAAIGYFLSSSEKIPHIISIPYYFVLVNISSLLGIIQALKGNIQVTWSPPRQHKSASSPVLSKRVGIIILLLIVSVSIFTEISLRAIN